MTIFHVQQLHIRFLLFFLIHMVFSGAIAVYLVFLMGNRPVKPFATWFCLMTMACVALVWFTVCWSPRRLPGYVWKDWKVGTE